jgi:di/tricarboxylate transporter
MDIVIVLLIVAAAMLLFATEVLSMDVVALIILCVLAVSGLVTPDEAVSGFSNPATITVAAMFVLSAGLNSTGALAAVGQRLIRHGKSETSLLILVMLLTALVSPFINNTAAVAVLLPLVISAAASRKIPNSKLLIPLSFASQFGGVCTLVGTSTNLLVSAISEQSGHGAFGMFDFTKLGLVMVAAGLVYFLTVGRWLLPTRREGELVATYGLGEYITELRVLPHSKLIGKTVLDAQLGENHEITVLEILRGDRKIWSPLYDPLHAGDILLVRGFVKNLFKLKNSVGLEIEPQFKLQDKRLGGEDMELVEALVPPRSTLIGRTLRGLDFHWRYKTIVLAIHRRGQVLRNKLVETRLRPGDALLLLGRKKEVEPLRRDANLVLLEPRRDVTLNRRKAPLALIIVALVVLVAALKILPIVAAALIGCVAMVLTRCLRPDDVYRSVDWRVIVLLAGVIPLGLALEKSGAAHSVVTQVLGLVGDSGPMVMLVTLYVMTSVLTEFISNNAAAVLLAPVAISAADTLGVDAKPFLIAVTFAASTSFATPVGYQTNTMVYTAGGYKFTDFLKVGLPLILIFCVLSMIFIPKLWPFHP